MALKKSTHLRECFLAVEASIFHNPDLLCPETEHSTNFKKKKKASNKLSQSFFFFFFLQNCTEVLPTPSPLYF